jgi:hypothetical protein
MVGEYYQFYNIVDMSQPHCPHCSEELPIKNRRYIKVKSHETEYKQGLLRGWVIGVVGILIGLALSDFITSLF